MKKGIVIFLIGVAAAGGAIDTGKDLLIPTTLIVIGMLMIWIFGRELYEKDDSDSHNRTADCDDSRPKFLRM